MQRCHARPCLRKLMHRTKPLTQKIKPQKPKQCSLKPKRKKQISRANSTPASRKLPRYANARREGKRTRLRPGQAPWRQPTVRRAPIYNRKSMTFGVSSMALRKKKPCWLKNSRTHSARHRSKKLPKQKQGKDVRLRASNAKAAAVIVRVCTGPCLRTIKL